MTSEEKIFLVDDEKVVRLSLKRELQNKNYAVEDFESAKDALSHITEDWPEDLEEIDIAVTLETGVVSEISVYRTIRDRGFADDELAQLSNALPLVAALLRRHWARFGASKLQTSPPDSRIDQIFANFGESVLTDREREVTQLILRGHSSESIGFNLDISLGTVKTHRRNAYAKLEISSQSELLSLFLKSFQAD